MSTASLRWNVFPRSRSSSEHQLQVLEVFRAALPKIGTPRNRLVSSEVLATVRLELCKLGYEMEDTRRVSRPVLFGENGLALKSYNVDGWHDQTKTVIEIEAGQAVENNRFALDLIKALSIQDARNLIVAVPANYHPERLRKVGKSPKRDFDEVAKHLDGLYSSGRVVMPLDSILVIGY